MSGMLYYPFVNATSAAINQAVLYWDFLSTVVPIPEEIRLNESMLELTNRGFYHPIEGTQVFRESSGNNFDLFTKLAIDLPLDDIIPSTNDPSLKSRRIYASKLGKDLSDELVRRGLAIPVQEKKSARWRSNAPLLIVAPRLQTALMSTAVTDYAGYVNSEDGILGDASLSPFTDEPFAFTNAHYVPSSDSWRASRNFRIEFGGLLPCPHESVAINDLFAFRDRYDDERRRLMLALELLLSGVSNHFEHSQDVVRAMQNEIESALKDMRDAAKSRRIGLVSKSLAVFVAVGGAGAALRVPDAAWILGVIGGMAINIATQETRGRRQSSSSYSYLYRVDRAIS